MSDRRTQRHGNVEVVGRSRPATGARAGDVWLAVPLAGERVLIAVGDVTGHGDAAADVADAVRDALGAMSESERSPGAVLDELDPVVTSAGRGLRAMTCLAMIIDAGRGRVEMANAGHNLPYRARHVEGRVDLAQLVAGGRRLGDEYLDGTERETCRLDLGAGDVLVAYTDGLVERPVASGEPWGEKAFRSALMAACSTSAEATHDALWGASERAGAGNPPADDTTLVVVCVLPPNP